MMLMGKIAKKKHPTFAQPNYGRSSRSRIKDRWRAPQGIDNKKRRKVKYMGASPSIGYRNAKEVRGMRKDDGLVERLVHNVAETDAVLADKDASKKYYIRICGTVGEKKRVDIRVKCSHAGVKVSN